MQALRMKPPGGAPNTDASPAGAGGAGGAGALATASEAAAGPGGAGSVNAESVPSCGEATYRVEPLALTSGAPDPSKMFAPMQGEPGRSVLCKQPRRVSAPVAGSRV